MKTKKLLFVMFSYTVLRIDGIFDKSSIKKYLKPSVLGSSNLCHEIDYFIIEINFVDDRLLYLFH